MTFEDWKFAARYGFFELEEYCRTSMDSRIVFVVLKDILRRPQGVEDFYNFGVTPRVMSRVAAGMVVQMDQLRAGGGELLSDTHTCLGCLRSPSVSVHYNRSSFTEGVCGECRRRCFESLHELKGPELRNKIVTSI
jgi:hypothetical protein